jgi:hypothetical protein
MKKFNFIALLLLSFSLVSAQVVKIGIKMNLEGKMSAFFYNISNGVLKINQEFFNTGSVAYKARVRLDIIDSKEIIFTGWSDEKSLMPGERKNFEIYYYTPQTLKEVIARIRVYYGLEIVEKEVGFKIENEQIPENIFKIKNLRIYDDHLRFEVRANNSLENVIIIPKNYTLGWIFEQKKIENLKADKNTEIVIPYKENVWMPHEMAIDIVTEDGKYYSTYSFKLKKEKGLLKYIHYLTDKLSLLLNAD